MLTPFVSASWPMSLSVVLSSLAPNTSRKWNLKVEERIVNEPERRRVGNNPLGSWGCVMRRPTIAGSSGATMCSTGSYSTSFRNFHHGMLNMRRIMNTVGTVISTTSRTSDNMMISSNMDSNNRTTRGCSLSISPLTISVRQAASFPTPKTGVSRRGPQKTFNFLTHERLVTTPVMPTQAAMKKENVYQAKLTHFREELMEKIEKHVHYYPKEVSNFVFHAIVNDRPQAKTFTGHRQLSAPTFARIQLLVLHELIKGKNRGKLLQLMAKANVPMPPKTLWDTFTDKKTGDITARLVYSKYVQKALRRLAVGRERGYLNVPSSYFYIGLHFFEEDKVPSLSEWWYKMGPVTTKDLVFNRSFGTHKRFIHQAKQDVLNYAKKEVDSAIAAYTTEDMERMITEFKKQSVSIMRRIEQHHLFSQSVLVAVGSLPEIRVIQGPKHAFQAEYNGLWYIQQKGAYYPDPKGCDNAWLQLSAEGKQKYLPFGTKPTGTRSGIQSFLKYCQRDYGLSLEEARERLGDLSDIQLAAMNFPFHVTLINDKNPVQRPFRRFLKKKLTEYGLLRPCKGDDGLRFHSNRLFTAVMRVKWMNMSAEERRAFEEEDIANVFPLQPTKHHPTNADGEGGTPSSRVMWSSLLPDKMTDEDSQRYLEEFGKRSRELKQFQEEHDAEQNKMHNEGLSTGERQSTLHGTPLGVPHKSNISSTTITPHQSSDERRKEGISKGGAGKGHTVSHNRRISSALPVEINSLEHRKILNNYTRAGRNVDKDTSGEHVLLLNQGDISDEWTGMAVDMHELELPNDHDAEE